MGPRDPNRRGPRVGVVADDFTSAMDAAAPFAAMGAVGTAAVTSGGEEPNHLDHDADLLAVDIDSRRRDELEAAARTAVAIACLRGAEILIKTVDSTLRGHVASELEAAWNLAGRARIVLAPAFPIAGRTTRDGVQLVDGVEVSATGFGSDRRHPVRSGALAGLLGEGPVHRWAPGDGPLAAQTHVVADAADDSDLDQLVAAAGPLEETLWVGSPGLASALARSLHGGSGTFVPQRQPAARIVVVVGSAHSVNVAQLERLEQKFGSRTTRTDDVAADLAIVAAPPAGAPISGADAESMSASLAARAGALVEAGFEGVIATGGETARAVVERLGEGIVEVLDEPAPGIVAARLGGSGLALVTKAGGFGDADTLVGLCDYLAGAETR